MSRFFFCLFLGVSFILFSCNNDDSDVNRSREVDPASIYFDYRVMGEEGNDSVTVLLHYRYAGENGSALTLDAPSQVKLDGQLITGDSTKMTGTFYEIQKPLEGFAGKHRIEFIDGDNKKYEEEFSFQPIKLRTEIAETVPRGNIELQLDGVQPGDNIRILMTDTAYASEGIDRTDTVKDGRLLITAEELKQLADGPIQLEIIKESETPVNKATREGGWLSITYRLKREFILGANSSKSN